ncbi:LapA family protein [Pseudarthrobacter enclensis]|uniref:LapA family protein n=1 Tax=Pseudarthrobacter enclensis TaxID=993070 RepID=UPI003EDF4BAD
MVWVATVTALVVLALLIVFMLQNQDPVQVQYLGLSGSLPLGIGLFIAAVAGGVLVAVAGAARITQLRRTATRPSRTPTPGTSWQPHRPLFKRRHHA